MFYSQNLLKKYINIHEDPKILGSKLTLKTCEIEEVIIRQLPRSIIIGRIESIKKHPDADKLFVCQVNCGQHGKSQIITGGENVQEGYFVPVVLPGAYLPAIDLKIEPRKMRGLDSIGMICSKEEIGINEDTDKHWIWLLDEDFDDLSNEDIGMPLIDKYPYLNNAIFDVDNKTLTNRPDLTGHFGLAVELNSIYSTFEINKLKFNKIADYFKTFKDTNIFEALKNSNKSKTKISAKSDNLMTYILLEINNVSVAKSNFFTRLLLTDMGSNPRNNRVDFSNLFVFCTGQPVHFFDAAKIDGEIIIRDAADGEEFIDLFDNKHILKSGDIVIADKSKILALAGIIGGKESGVSDDTKNILVEIANFDPVQVRRTGTRLGLRTDAELRYEKTISPIFSLYALLLFLDELKYFSKDLGEYEIGGLDYYIKPGAGIEQLLSKSIELDLLEVENFIFGKEVEGFGEIARVILNGLGFEGNGSKFVVPVWRGTDDINIKQDLYEEIIRIYGYENVQPQKIKKEINYVKYSDNVYVNRQIERIAVENFNFSQIETYPWVDEEILDIFEVEKSNLFSLQNATAPQLKNLRDSLIYNVLQAIAKNSRTFDEIAFFEVGKIWQKIQQNFDRAQKRPDMEKNMAILALYSKSVEGWQEDLFLKMKGYISKMFFLLGLGTDIVYKPKDMKYLHPKKAGSFWIKIEGQDEYLEIGTIGQIHPVYNEYFKFNEKSQVVFAQFDVNEVKNLLNKKQSTFGFAKYETLTDQILFRDLNFVIDRGANFGDVIKAIKNIPEIKGTKVFDIYAGENLDPDKKSIAVQIKILGDGKFTTEKINEVMNKAISEVEKIGGKLRA